MQTIDRAHPVMIDDEGPEMHMTTWGEFVDANADGMEPEEIAEISAALLKHPGCTYFGGGGAAAKWTMRLLIGDMEAFEKWRATRKQVENLADDEVGEASDAEGPGYVYDCACFIEINDEQTAAKHGKYTLVVENWSACSSDLNAMEWLLWEHWASHQLGADYPNIDAVTDADIARAAGKDDLDDACRNLQVIANIADGGGAGIYFSEIEEEWSALDDAARAEHLRAWLKTERVTP